MTDQPIQVGTVNQSDYDTVAQTSGGGYRSREWSPELVDTDDLPPTQYLVLELLAARHRLGHREWTLPDRFLRQVTALEQLGLVRWRSHPEPKCIYAWLTEAGRRAAMSDEWPGIRVIAVANWRRERIHGITADPEEAKRWVREITDRHGDPCAASQCADLVRPGAHHA